MITIIRGIIASQPVVVTLEKQIAVTVLIRTKDGYQKFFYKIPKNYNARKMATTTFSDIVLTSVGDAVRVRVSVHPSGQIEPEIKNFLNDTKGLGYL